MHAVQAPAPAEAGQVSAGAANAMRSTTAAFSTAAEAQPKVLSTGNVARPDHDSSDHVETTTIGDQLSRFEGFALLC